MSRRLACLRRSSRNPMPSKALIAREIWSGSVPFASSLGTWMARRNLFLRQSRSWKKPRLEQPKNFSIPLFAGKCGSGIGEQGSRPARDRTRSSGHGCQRRSRLRPRHRGKRRKNRSANRGADAAIARIERLLPLAYGAFPLTQAKLRIEPVWDPLRSHPRFKALVEGSEPKTIYQ